VTSRAAPSVRLEVKRPPALLWVGVSVWVASLLCLVAWTTLSGAVYGRQASVALVCLAAGPAFAVSWRAMLQGQLAWDGLLWTWQRTQADSQLVVLAVKIDLQGWMLLQIRDLTGQSVGWVCAQRSNGPAQWLDFRRAVYSRRQHAPTPPDS
jgi:hypothetical protein